MLSALPLPGGQSRYSNNSILLCSIEEKTLSQKVACGIVGKHQSHYPTSRSQQSSGVPKLQLG
ncbi:MAG: hypothetical protein MUD14_18860 [Hydrococcus sp. Prado102]|nr:hypothetical protein [Hydrococcus sp. Prado102]